MVPVTHFGPRTLVAKFPVWILFPKPGGYLSIHPALPSKLVEVYGK
jgi:hypothetical protein